ncbi:MAG: AAA family ATPase [Planktothrix sp.]|uniref:AAA family ATPase n=1 Tax=unclassified Planktothrix TaxID=2648599 RepID=UPI001682A29A|nr:AAA family ATPase [Planktothrix sp. FACHB-1365]MBD2482211.1 AAA family ATPase [Planktothrix sp. FACHB-1365]
MKSPVQKILFGSPGTGKSHKIVHEIIPALGIGRENVIKTVFHPEYTYGDFVGKLIPVTKGEKVQYKFFSGHFLCALSKAYRKIFDVYKNPTKDKNFKNLSIEEQNILLSTARSEACQKAENVILVIDEINRGNSSAIFGTVFQLLDRNDDGWSSYRINVPEIEILKILELMGVKDQTLATNQSQYKFPGEGDWVNEYTTFQNRLDCLDISLEDRAIKIPPNLSIVGTMNTSDNSIYFMDSAFKRRWEWEFIDWDESEPEPPNYSDFEEYEWKKLVKQINLFIKSHHDSVRGIEDKQVGYFFINYKNNCITSEQIRNKLMFFLWDSVFNRDKRPLVDLLEVDRSELITFGDFTKLHNIFIEKIRAFTPKL